MFIRKPSGVYPGGSVQPMVGVAPPPLTVTLVGCGTLTLTPTSEGPGTVNLSAPLVNVRLQGEASRLALKATELAQKFALTASGPQACAASLKPLGG